MDKKYFLKLLVLLSGNICAAFGVFLCTVSHKGVDPITVFLQGLTNTLNVSIGSAVLIFHGVLMIICFALDRKSIKFGTIFAVLSFSLSLNLFMTRYSLLSSFENTATAWIFIIVGIVFMGVGFSIGIFANIGYNTADVLLNILTLKTKLSFKLCKSTIDLCCTVFGIMLGGRFGIGTILCVLFVGSIYSKTLKSLEKTKEKTKKDQYILIKENY